MPSLKGKVIFITGASRGIGKEIALKAAKEGALVVVASKTTSPHPKLPGTIYQTADEIKALGGDALPLEMDLRNEQQIQQAVEAAVKKFGGIDILVNNASAIYLKTTNQLSIKQYQLMQDINVRGTFFCSQACIPYLKKSSNPHILMMSPPLNIKKEYFKDHLGYTISKFGMSMCVLGMAAEFSREGIAVNALWPQSIINTSALQAIFEDPAKLAETQKHSRHPSIMADAACYIFSKSSRLFTGRFLTDEIILKEAGVRDFTHYSESPGHSLIPDFFLN